MLTVVQRGAPILRQTEQWLKCLFEQCPTTGRSLEGNASVMLSQSFSVIKQPPIASMDSLIDFNADVVVPRPVLGS